MATSSISGLVSGLDTATIISQLMQLEAIPQSKLKGQLSSVKTSLSSLQTINSMVAGIAAKAKELAEVDNWSALQATSSLPAVSATASAGATPGQWSVQVDRVATTHRLRFDTPADLDEVVVPGGGSITITVGGNTSQVDVGDGTLASVVGALNASGTPVFASTIRLDDGRHRLVVQSRETGEASRFTLTAADGSPLLGGASVVDAEDAVIRIEGETITSSTNTFDGVLDGVSLVVTAPAVGETTEITVSADRSSAVNTVRALVDQVNNVIGQVQSLTGFNAATGSSGLLARESSVRAAGVALQQAAFPNDGTSLASLGIQTDRYGKLVFDETAFTDALAADPTAVRAAITGPDGFAARVERAAVTASDPTNGTITAAITGRNSSITRLESDIEAWDRRLELRQNSLQRTYSALEVALSTMQSQSSWLASQLSSLSANASS